MPGRSPEDGGALLAFPESQDPRPTESQENPGEPGLAGCAAQACSKVPQNRARPGPPRWCPVPLQTLGLASQVEEEPGLAEGDREGASP